MKKIIMVLFCCFSVALADQKLADKTKEMPISIIAHNGSMYCYTRLINYKK